MGEHQKKALALGMVVGAVMVMAATGLAAENRTQGQTAVPEGQSAADPTPAPLPVTSAPAPAKPTSPEDKARVQLDGTRWALELIALPGGDKVKPQKDAVTFSTKQVTSEQLSKAGYPSSNYTVTIDDNGVPVWETMQTKEGEGVAFWRGELQGSNMRGILSKQPTKGSAEDFSFVGHASGRPAIGVSPEPSADVPAVGEGAPRQASTPAPAAEPPKKKRKGLFGR